MTIMNLSLKINEQEEYSMYTGQKVRLRAYRREDIPIRLNYINDTEIANSLTGDIPYPIMLHEEENWFESI